MQSCNLTHTHTHNHKLTYYAHKEENKPRNRRKHKSNDRRTAQDHMERTNNVRYPVVG